MRYNRLIDTFLGSDNLQFAEPPWDYCQGISQIEIDELYIGLDRHGCHYVIPVQAKGERDQIGVVQISQDLAFATEKFPDTRCKPIAAQFMSDNIIAIFELTLSEGEVKVVEKRHYKLVPSEQLDSKIIHNYRIDG